MIIDLRILNSRYKINCADEDEEKIRNLANQLNERLGDLESKMKTSDEKTLLLIAALSLQDQINQSDEEKEGFEKEELYERLNDNIENITSYIEKISTKISNY
jgi:cell division protein ZapA (FtsZ GTPase activity inhibitor)